MTLAALDAVLRELLVAGPSSLSPIERSIAFASLRDEALPPRAARALDELVTTGAASALLDLCAWVQSSRWARAQLATARGELAPAIVSSDGGPAAVSLDDRPFEQWIRVVSERDGDDARRAISLLATADPAWLDGLLAALERTHDAPGDRARWLLAPLRSMAPRAPLTERLFRWLERAPSVWRGSLLVALSRSDEVDTDPFEREASKGIDDPDHRSLVLGATLDRAPERGVRIAFAWLAAGGHIDRSTHLRALEAAVMRFVPEAPALAARRLQDGPFAWEVDRLERIARH